MYLSLSFELSQQGSFAEGSHVSMEKLELSEHYGCALWELDFNKIIHVFNMNNTGQTKRRQQQGSEKYHKVSEVYHKVNEANIQPKSIHG